MFKGTISDPSVFKDSITTIGELIDEGIFKINDKGMSLVAADRAMVAVVDFKLPPTVFEKFENDKEEEIAVNISNLVSILKRVKSKDKLKMELKGNKLEILIENSSKRRFTVPLLEVSKEEIPPIDELDFKAKVKLKSDILKSGIEDADVVGDSVVLGAKDNEFNMKATGDITSSELILKKDNKSLLDFSVKGSVLARYPLEYLKKMIKASKLADEAVIKWSTDYPMKLDFSSLDKVSLGFVLAPRVTED
ncbi:MAG: proliferating cell nuclear antigen (pcna) [Candidatus Aenigmarchaeota archaeon]|nr:proliferating cell nuclear antigen (pcna) [Candidatus Aenigmarchaeota archaeon]